MNTLPADFEEARDSATYIQHATRECSVCAGFGFKVNQRQCGGCDGAGTVHSYGENVRLVARVFLEMCPAKAASE